MKIRHLIITLSIYILASCSSTEEHNHEGHNHDQEEGHDHEKQTSSQRPIVDYTLWTNKTELFVEFPTLVVGKKSKFTSYFTQLNGYNPIKEGSVKVSLLEGKMRRSKLATKPLRDGVFHPSLTPQKAGFYSITFILNSSSFNLILLLSLFNLSSQFLSSFLSFKI